MGPIIPICIMRLLLLLSIFLIATNTQNIANADSTNDVLNETDVTSPLPVHAATHILKALIQEEGQPIIKLRWTKTEQIVANQNLPVWGAQCGDIHESKTTDVEQILKHFVMYQDLEHESAIVYVTGKELIYGNIGTKYYIHDLPVEDLLRKRVLKVGGPYVRKNPDFESHEASVSTPSVGIHPADDTTNRDDEEQTDLHKVPANRKKRDAHGVLPNVEAQEVRQKFYVETLLFVTHDIVAPIKSEHPDDYLFHILLHYAVYFNGIDMMFAKLATKFRIYVNIAGIIFEEDEDVFSSIIKSPILDYTERNESLVLEGFARLFSNYYLLDPNFVMPVNSFDLVFISTSRGLEFEDVAVLGQSFGGIDIYDMRQTRTHQMIGIPKSIVRNSDIFTSFAVGAQEVGNVFAYHNPDEEHCIEESQEQVPVCDHCTEWKPDTVNGIEKFMRENRNRCWLLNYPRSITLSNIPQVTLLPSEQCQCFGYDAYGKQQHMIRTHVPYNSCVRALRCGKSENGIYTSEPTILPFDGIPCQRGSGKVCWQQSCVPVGVPYQKQPLA